MNNHCLKIAVLLLVLAIPISLAAQQSQQSLGDLARHLREQREKSPQKSVRVYTNDDLKSLPGENSATSSTKSPEGEGKANPSPTAEASEKPAETRGAEKAGSSEDKKKTKEYWQERFKAARGQLAKAEEVLQLTKDELNLLQIEQARAIDANAKEDLDTKVKAKQAEVDANQAAVDKAKKQLNDLQKEFDESGAPAEWSQGEEKNTSK